MKTKKTVQTTVHMPAELKKKIDRLRAKDRRSFSTMVIVIIEEWLDAINQTRQ